MWNYYESNYSRSLDTPQWLPKEDRMNLPDPSDDDLGFQFLQATDKEVLKELSTVEEKIQLINYVAFVRDQGMDQLFDTRMKP